MDARSPNHWTTREFPETRFALSTAGENNLGSRVLEHAWLFALFVKILALRSYVMLDLSLHS